MAVKVFKVKVVGTPGPDSVVIACKVVVTKGFEARKHGSATHHSCIVIQKTPL